jgi:hypothetical protein
VGVEAMAVGGCGSVWAFGSPGKLVSLNQRQLALSFDAVKLPE